MLKCVVIKSSILLDHQLKMQLDLSVIYSIEFYNSF